MSGYRSDVFSYQLDSFQIDFAERFVGKKVDNILGLGTRNSAPLRLRYREQKVRLRTPSHEM